MARYMPQDVFDAIVYTLGVAAYNGQSPAHYAQLIAQQETKRYRDDPDILRQHFVAALDRLQRTLPAVYAHENFKAKDYTQICHVLFKAATEFHPSGKPRNRFFRGSIFSRQGTPLADPVKRFEANLILYTLCFEKGLIDPVALSKH